MESNLLHIEELFNTYDAMTKGTGLPDELKATVMIELCNKELREYLGLSTEATDLVEVRRSIVNYIERKRDEVTSGVKAMEVDNVEHEAEEDHDKNYQEGHWGEWQYPEAEELNYMSKGWGKGKGTSKGYGKSGPQFYNSKGKRKE